MSGDQTFSSGEYIFREGESAVYGYIVKSGIVEIVKHGSGGDQVLAELEPPTIFGEMALIDGSPRSAGAPPQGTAAELSRTLELLAMNIENRDCISIRV